jgi:anti-anti-sigma factor
VPVLRSVREGLSGGIAVVEERGVPVARLSGEIDGTVVAACDRCPAAPFPSVIDASAVTFLDCRGLRFLIDSTRAARRAGRTPELRRPTRVVRRVLDLTGARDLFLVTP